MREGRGKERGKTVSRQNHKKVCLGTVSIYLQIENIYVYTIPFNPIPLPSYLTPSIVERVVAIVPCIVLCTAYLAMLALGLAFFVCGEHTFPHLVRSD